MIYRAKLSVRIVDLILFLFLGLLNVIQTQVAWSYELSGSSAIKIVYPKPGSVIDAPSSFIVGQVIPGTNLTCNGESVRVNKPGYFAHVVPLHYGANQFHLYSADNNINLDWTIARKTPPKPISPHELKIEDLKPNVDLGIKPGDIIYFSAHATPYALVSVQLGSHCLTLSSTKKTPPTTSVAYGKVVQRLEQNGADLYKGSYRVVEGDHFLSVHPEYKLVSRNGSLTIKCKATISTVERLSVARTIKAPTVVRLGPGLARTTPLADGVKVAIDGWLGDNMRCLYSPNLHVWIKKQDLILDSERELSRETSGASENNSDDTVPHAVAQTINIIDDSYGEKVCLPLDERLPYQIEQKLNPNCLIMRVYGVSADTDWITCEPKANGAKSVIDHVSWRQVEDNLYEVTVYLSDKRQWGYQVNYNGTTLCLDIKHPPKLFPDSMLSGIKICIDPGHGGSEIGATGCSGIPESQINFDIASKVKLYLEASGATVIMTRIAQNQNVSLDERVKIATDNGVDFLISIHNNALPDGRDPWKEHGTSSYWYHPQSIELASCLKESVKSASGFLDLGARYQNLALARATAMPSVLLEIGFMINPDEFAALIDSQSQSKIA